MLVSRWPAYVRPSHHGRGSSARAWARVSRSRPRSRTGTPGGASWVVFVPGGSSRSSRPGARLAPVLGRHVADDDLGEGARVAVGRDLAPVDPARQIGLGVDGRDLDDADGVGEALDGEDDAEHPVAVDRPRRGPQRPGGLECAAVEGDRVDAVGAAAREGRARGGDDGRARHRVVPRHPAVVDQRLGHDRPVDGLRPALAVAVHVDPPGSDRRRERFARPRADLLGDAQHLPAAAERRERPRLHLDVGGPRREGQGEHEGDGQDERGGQADGGDAEPRPWRACGARPGALERRLDLGAGHIEPRRRGGIAEHARDCGDIGVARLGAVEHLGQPAGRLALRKTRHAHPPARAARAAADRPAAPASGTHRRFGP